MFWRRKEKPAGDIAGAGLSDWWLKTFSPQEREYITSRFEPMGNSQPRRLVEGEPHRQDAGRLLSGLSSWFRAPADRKLERVMLEEAVRRTDKHSFDRHLIYGSLMVNWYRDRDRDPVALQTALDYARLQVDMSKHAAKAWRKLYDDKLPSHQGYEQLAIIAEKQHNFADAIELARRAKREGWAGDWDKRIDRCAERSKKAR